MKALLGISVLTVGFLISCGQAGDRIQRLDAVQKAIQIDPIAAGGFCDEKHRCGPHEECRSNRCVGI